MREICLFKGHRIIELLDDTFSLSDLEGDIFDPEVNAEIDPKQLRKERDDFRRKVTNEGVYGYVLQKWNPEVGKGWEQQDSCGGFVGEYDSEKNRHYIVDEFLDSIN